MVISQTVLDNFVFFSLRFAAKLVLQYKNCCISQYGDAISIQYDLCKTKLQGNVQVKPAPTSTHHRNNTAQTYASIPLPLKLHQHVTTFVVLGTQRTGSNMLCGFLSGVRGIAMHNELFNDKAVFTHIGDSNLPTSSIYKRDAAPEEFLVQALSIDPLCQVCQ